MCLSLSISVHSLVLESPKPSVKAFKEEKDSNNMSLGDSSTKWWTEIERLSHIYTVTPFSRRCNMFQWNEAKMRGSKVCAQNFCGISASLCTPWQRCSDCTVHCHELTSGLKKVIDKKTLILQATCLDGATFATIQAVEYVSVRKYDVIVMLTRCRVSLRRPKSACPSRTRVSSPGPACTGSCPSVDGIFTFWGFLPNRTSGHLTS